MNGTSTHLRKAINEFRIERIGQDTRLVRK
jgi:hypothetical protein